MSKFSEHQWIDAMVNQHKLREQLFGDSMNPRITKAKKQQKRCREALFRSPCDMDVFFKKVEVKKQLPTDIAEVPTSFSRITENLSYSFLTENQHKEKKKGKKKRKKHRKLAQQFLSENLFDSENKSGNLMAEVMKYTSNIILVNNQLYVYQDDFGCYKECSYRDVARELRSLLDYDDQLKITSRQYKESYEQLLLSEELERKEGFFENAPLVNCLNGVVDVKKGILFERSPEYYFKHCIQANFIPDGGKCERFLEFVEHITCGNKDLKKLLRVIMGYIFSHYNNGKKAILLYAIPHIGKSVLCSLIERILGKQYICHVDLSMLQRQEYAASLSGKLLNVAPDLKNESLSDVGFFKSLVSHNDTIAARSLYNNPTDIRCETKMLFSTNHLLSFDSSLDVLDIEAVFNRLLYFPFQNKPISDKEDNKHLSDILFEERDLIFTWAMKGLREYVENNETFPNAKLSEEIKQANMSRYCPEKVFFKTCLKEASGQYESSSAIKDAFSEFCYENNISKKADIGRFLDEHQRIPKVKKRIDDNGNLTSVGNPIYVYEGIRLKNKCRKYKKSNVFGGENS